MVTEANSVMKDALTAHKWEVISYLSGVSVHTFQSRVPEWYLALQDAFASMKMRERVKKEKESARQSEEEPSSD